MNRITQIFQFLLLVLVTSTALAASQSSCEERSMREPTNNRHVFMQNCLAQTNTPEHLRAIAAAEKRATCEQNAKNMKMEGGRRGDYINSCANKNEAIAEAKRYGIDSQGTATARPQHVNIASVEMRQAETPRKHKAAKKQEASAAKHKRNCSKEAGNDGLKGKKRRNFLVQCRNSQ